MDGVAEEPAACSEDDQFLKRLVRLLDEIVGLTEQLERLDSEFRDALESRRVAEETG